MKNRFCYWFWLIAIASLYVCSTANAQDYVTVVKDLDCGAFRAHAETVATKPPDFFSHVARQTIRITIPGRRGSVVLDLHQKRSPDMDLGGRLQVDGTADFWRCVITKAGKRYLYIAFSCNNVYAKTCPYGMQMPGKEWEQFYDLKGHGFLRNPQRETRHDEVRLREQSLWDESIGIHEDVPIY